MKFDLYINNRYICIALSGKFAIYSHAYSKFMCG
jgi:hypothetical protein